MRSSARIPLALLVVLASSRPAAADYTATILQWTQADFTQSFAATNPAPGVTDLSTPAAGVKVVVTYTPNPLVPSVTVTDTTALMFYIGVKSDGLATGSNTPGSTISQQFSGEMKLTNAAQSVTYLDAKFTDSVAEGTDDSNSPTRSATDGITNAFGHVEAVTFTSSVINLAGSFRDDFSVASSSLDSPGSPSNGLHLTATSSIAAYTSNKSGTFAVRFSVPEPASAALVVVGGVVLSLPRLRRPRRA